MVAMGRKGFISLYPTHLSLSFPICLASACHMCNRAIHKGGEAAPQLHSGLYYWEVFILEKLFLHMASWPLFVSSCLASF